jgi:transcriptional regulator with XRE-family HTH domain
MEWRQIRAEFERAFSASGLTQTDVAKVGGIGQNAISKTLHNKRKGPTVETFVLALRGLGIAPSEFFRLLEDRLAHGNEDDVGLDVTYGQGASRSIVQVKRTAGNAPPMIAEAKWSKAMAAAAAAMAAFFKVVAESDSPRPPNRARSPKRRPRP